MSERDEPLNEDRLPEAADTPPEGDMGPSGAMAAEAAHQSAATARDEGGSVGGPAGERDAGSAAESPATPEGKQRAAGASAPMVAAGILLSRVAGFVRMGVFSNYFGASGSVSGDAFTTALRMPNVLQNLLGEGVLSASFIPVYSELLEEGREEEAGRVAGAVFALLMAIAGVIALFGVIAAPLLVRVFTPGFEGLRYELTVTLTRIIFPMTGILVLSAWALGVLNSHRHFFIPYFAPVLWNAAMITAMLVFGPRVARPELAMALAWGALIGGVLQFGIQLPAVIKLERSLRIRWDLKLAGVRTAIRNAGPAIFGRGVVQLSGWLDLILASFLIAGAVTVIQYAQTLFVLPISLFGMSVAAAELPELARQRKQATGILQERINRSLNQITFFVVPSVVGYIVLGDVVVATLYERGEFNRIDTLLVYFTLAAFSIGLLASTRTRLFSSAYFALHDTKTPAKYAAFRVLLAAGLGAALMFSLDNIALGPSARLGPVGLALGSGIAAWLEWWLLRRSLRKRIGAVGADGKALGRMIVIALAAAAVARGVDWLLPPLAPILVGLIVLPIFAGIYLGLAHVLGVGQAASALGRFVRRFRSG